MNQIRVRDRGQVTKVTTRNDQDDCCLLSNLPIVAGQYHILAAPSAIPRLGARERLMQTERLHGIDFTRNVHHNDQDNV